MRIQITQRLSEKNYSSFSVFCQFNLSNCFEILIAYFT